MRRDQKIQSENLQRCTCGPSCAAPGCRCELHCISCVCADFLHFAIADVRISRFTVTATVNAVKGISKQPEDEMRSAHRRSARNLPLPEGTKSPSSLLSLSTSLPLLSLAASSGCCRDFAINHNDADNHIQCTCFTFKGSSNNDAAETPPATQWTNSAMNECAPKSHHHVLIPPTRVQ